MGFYCGGGGGGVEIGSFIFFGFFTFGLLVTTLTSLALFRSSEHIIVYIYIYMYYKDNNEIYDIG